MNIGKIIREYRQKNSLSTQSFADKCELSKGYISMLENGVNPRSNKPIAPTLPSLKKVAHGLDMDIDALMKILDGNQRISMEQYPENTVNIIANLYPIELKRFPMLGEIACGEPKFTNENRESYVMAGTNIKADFCLRAKGDSMINARIYDGDIVFIRKQDTVENGDIAVVVVNNDSEATLKRFFYYQEKALLILKPENSSYEDQIYQGEELNQVHVLGKAIAFQSDIK